MAFKDITKVLYDGKIKLDYKDKAHRYYVRTRIDFDLPESDPKAWSKVVYPKGTTTLIGDTLEKKGLMTWPLGLAIRELFGFYDFKDDEGNQRIGYSEGVGTLWDGDNLVTGDKKSVLAQISSANKAWVRAQKKGADIGSVVHDAIEHFIKGTDFDIAENYSWNIKESHDSILADLTRDLEAGKITQEMHDLIKSLAEKDNEKAIADFDEDVAMATKAFLRFQKWWLTLNPELHSAEDILYSQEFNTCGTYDGDFSMPTARHPLAGNFDKETLRITADWKTSNASSSKDAAAPEGVYYSYFVQLGIYELMRREMGFPAADDLLTVSARKDGEFSLVYASELGLSVQDCIDWAIAVITCYGFADRTKKALLAHGEEAAGRIDSSKEAF